MAFNFYDTHTLLASVQQLPPLHTFLLDRYFPTNAASDIFATDDVLVEYKKGSKKAAPFVAPRKGGITILRDGYTMKRFTPAHIAPKRPLSITAFCFWLIEHRIQKATAKREKEEEERHKKQEEREKLREKNELLLVQSVGAAIALGEATARAVQRIPDAHCNGDMHAALEYAAKVKHEQKEFLTEQGIGSLYD